MRGYWVML
jgi:dynein heavy chain